MFFLITYAMINVVVLIEQDWAGQFPPHSAGAHPGAFAGGRRLLLRHVHHQLHYWVYFPFWWWLCMFTQRAQNLERQEGDTRSGMFNSLAEWFTKVVNRLPATNNERSWQPNLLIPAQSNNDVVRAYRTIYNLTRP